MTNSAPDDDPLFLSDLTWVEAREVLDVDCIVLLPVGAIEAHGPHLPLDTDVIIAVETARRAAVRLRARDRSSIVVPAIAYGVSYVGGPFAGTIPAASAIVSTLVEQVIAGVAAFGPRRFAVANAHLEPAHIEAVRQGAERAAVRAGVAVVVPDQREPRWAATLSDEFRRGSRHAGSYETSLVLAAAPHKVRTHLLPALPAVWIDLPGKLRAGARTFADAGGTEAYFGDPARATAAEGERLFDALATMIELSIFELDQTSPERPR